MGLHTGFIEPLFRSHPDRARREPGGAAEGIVAQALRTRGPRECCRTDRDLPGSGAPAGAAHRRTASGPGIGTGSFRVRTRTVHTFLPARALSIDAKSGGAELECAPIEYAAGRRGAASADRTGP